MLTGGARLVRGMHQVMDTPFVEHVRRRVHPEVADEVVSYYCPLTGRFVVGVWVNRMAGAVADILSYHRTDRLTDEHVLQVMFNLNNDRRVRALKQWVRGQFAEVREQHRFWVDTELERKDYRDFAKRQAGPMVDPNDPRWLAAF